MNQENLYNLIRQFEDEIDEGIEDDNDIIFNTDEIEEGEVDVVLRSLSEEQLKHFTNFNLQSFNELFNVLSDDITNLRSNRGRRQRLSDKDLLLLFLCFLKTYLTGSKYTAMFRISADSTNKLINKMITAFHETLKRTYIESVVLETSDKSFPEVKIIVDCSVQEVPRYTGNFRDAKLFYSKKHGRYCLKREYAHVRSGQVIYASPAFPGSKHDFSVFLSSLDYYKNLLKKEEAEGHYSIMADRGYEGIRNYIESVTPIKGRNLSYEQTVFNNEVGRARIICENFYGRMKFLWAAARNKVHSSILDYEKLNDICIALTNYHLKLNPLRRRDGLRYRVVNSPHGNSNSSNASIVSEELDPI